MWRVAMILWLLATGLRADRVRDYHEWHQACLKAENAKLIDGYVERFQSRLDADPEDQLARVYLGSALTLRSAETFWGPTKLDFLKKGGKLMDEAVARAPEDPRVRFLRATNAYRVPKRFGRRDTAIRDFEWLMPIAIKGGHGLTLRERQAILYYTWRIFEEEGRLKDAEKARTACHQLDQTSWYGGESGKRGGK